MMNVLGVSLVITSLAAAGILSPQQKQGASTIVKEGHRVVVVEYDQGGHQNTKISISPEQATHQDHDDYDYHVLDNAKDNIKGAASVLPNLGEGISQDAPFLHAPKELICDIYGKCRHKMADAIEKSKDKAQEALHKKKDEIAGSKKAVQKVTDALKESVYDKARDVHEYAQDTVETVKDHVSSNISEARNGLRHALKIESLNSFMCVTKLLGFATAYGICVWVTFISSYVQSRAMSRQQFAVVQSKIYPVYFRAMTYSVGVALFGHVFSHTNAHILQAYNLVASLLTLLINSLYLEPRATKLMFERIKIEKEEGRGREDMSDERSRTDPKVKDPSTTADQDAVRSRIIKLNDKLNKLNSCSSFLNILNLMSLTWHLVYLAQQLHHTC